MKRIKPFQLLLALALWLFGGVNAAMSQDIIDLNIRPLSAGLQNSGGQGGPRIDTNYFDPGNSTWYTTVYDTVCDRFSMTDDDGYHEFRTPGSGSYQFYFYTRQGFDSLVTVYFFIKTSTGHLLTQTACDSFLWALNHTTYYVSGDYNYSHTDKTNVQGCDSVEILRLSVFHSHSVETSDTACNSYNWGRGFSHLTTSGDYVKRLQTNPGGCDSTITLHLTIYYSDTVTDAQNVCDSYTWNGTTYTSSTTVVRTFQNIHTCDSVVTLALTVRHRSFAPDETRSVCDRYVWHGSTYTVSGTYSDTLFGGNRQGCDSISRLNLTIRRSNSYTLVDQACDSYTWDVSNFGGGGTYTRGVYTASTTAPYPTATVTNRANCDSVITLHLTVNYSDHTGSDAANVCDSIVWNGSTYRTTGNYPYATHTSKGCDSTCTLHLTVRNSNVGTHAVTVCDQYTWRVANADLTNPRTRGSYTASNSTDTAMVVNAAGCDSTVRLRLTVNHKSFGTDTQTACDSYTWTNGVTYTASTNTPRDTHTNAAGCDSIVTLNLTIRRSTHAAESVTRCDSYTWHGTPYTASGIYTYDYANAAGCPSTDTLHLTINHSAATVQTETACDRYTWINGITYTASTTAPTHMLHTIHGCDSVVNLHLTVNHSSSALFADTACEGSTYHWQGGAYTASGIYHHTRPNAAGCDSNMTLALLFISHNTHTTTATSCDSYRWNGNTYTASTTDTVRLTNKWGCDSLDVLCLTVHHSHPFTDSHSPCDSLRWIDGNLYTADNHTATKMLRTTEGCDSLVTLDLTLRHSTSGIDAVEACDQYAWHGTTYTSSTTTPTFRTTNAAGCDSTATLHLTIYRRNLSGTVNANVCDSYTWHDSTYSQTPATPPTYSTTTVHGCDSMCTLYLTVRHNSNAAFAATACDSYIWNNHGSSQTYTATGTYTHAYNSTSNCPSVDTLHLTVHYKNLGGYGSGDACDSVVWGDSTYYATGGYRYPTHTVHGCDSLTTVSVTVRHSNHSYATANVCDQYLWHGVSYTSSNSDLRHLNPGANAQHCDSTEHLNLTIRRSTSSTFSQNVCDSFYWSDAHTTYYSSCTPTATIPNAAGCDSNMTLRLTVRHSTDSLLVAHGCDKYRWKGVNYINDTAFDWHTTNVAGCDSTVHFNLIMDASKYVHDTFSRCDSARWHGTLYTASNNTAFYRTVSVAGCDSIEYLHLTINRSTTTRPAVASCDSYAWQDTLFRHSGNAYRRLATTKGCDSNVYINVTIYRSDSSTVDVQNHCDSYTWPNNGVTYTSSVRGVRDTLATSKGCDSIITLNLTIRHSTSFTDVRDVCDTLVWHGTAYTASTTTPTFDTVNAAGCDSLTTLHLTVRHSTSRTDAADVCDTFTWVNGRTYTVSNNTDVYRIPGGNAAGCDSVARLSLTVRHKSYRTDRFDVCDSLTWIDGVRYTASTTTPTFTLSMPNAAGCDSVAKLDLTVRHSTSHTDVRDVCDTLVWHGTTYTASTATPTFDTVNAVGCDSLTTLHLTVRHATTSTDPHNVCDSFLWVNGRTYTADNNTDTWYVGPNEAGCDSSLLLDLTVRHSTASTTAADECDFYTWSATGETYTRSLDTLVHRPNAAGCDSALTLRLVIRHRDSSIVNADVCDSYTWHGTTYTASTDTPTFDTVNAVGCDSTAHLHLTVRHSTSYTDVRDVCDTLVWHGTAYTASTTSPTFDTVNAAGCDSLTMLHLTVRHSTSRTDAADVCDTFTWVNGRTYTVSNNTDVYRIPGGNAAGCDSVARLSLTVRHKSYRTDRFDVCDSLTWIDGVRYTASTTTPTFTLSMPNAAGCDSVAKLDLTVRHSTSYTDVRDVCDTLVWHGTAYTASTATPTFDTVNAVGCDSLTTLHLTVRHATTSADPHNVCDSFLWVNGRTYTADNNTDTWYVGPNEAGCDSSLLLDLTVRHSTASTTAADECDFYTWSATGETYTRSLDTLVHRPNAAGCDSALTLRLIIRHRDSSIVNADVCDSYTWHGTTYTASTDTPTFDTVNAVGCDSTAHLHLTVRHSTSYTDVRDVCDTLVWHGAAYTASTTTPTFDTVNAAGCDSLTTLHLTVRHSTSRTDAADVCDTFTWVNGRTYTVSNNTDVYHIPGGNAAGCDSVARLSLTVRHKSYRTDRFDVCDSLTWIDGVRYTASTTTPTFTLSVPNAEGCDSVAKLDLTVRHSTSYTDVRDVCDTLVWHGTAYTASTATPTFDTVNAVGCDSLTRLHLTVRHATTSTDPHNVCDSFLWVNGRTYTADNNTDTWYVGPNEAGCDSSLLLDLTVRHSTASTTAADECDFYTWSATGETYTRSLDTLVHRPNAAGCDSALTLRLVVRHRDSSIVNADVCDSYTWHGTTYTASTDTPTFDTVNAVGCDSTAHLHLTVRYSTSYTDVRDVCDTLVWHGAAYTASTTSPTFDTVNAAGCDSLTTLHLTVRHSTSRTDAADVCDTFTWVNGRTYTVSNNTDVYHIPGGNAAGCDSVARLSLTVRHKSYRTDRFDVCDSLTWIDGVRYTASTTTPTFTLSMPNAAGCDSVAKLDLTVRHSTSYTDVRDVCDTLVWHGTAYTASTATPTFDTVNAVGCDSLTTLNLTVRYRSWSNDPHDVCDTFTWVNHRLYTSSDSTSTYSVGLNEAGCDSSLHLHLTVRYSSTSLNTPNVCDEYYWNATGETYYRSLDTVVYLTNVQNCDSVLTMNLVVRHRDSSIVNVNVCDYYTWHDSTYTASTTAPTFDTVNAVGCDSTAHLHLTVRYSTSSTDVRDVCDTLVWHGTAYTASTTTPTFDTINAAGCDSLTTLHLTVRHSTSRTDAADVCDTFTWVNGRTYTVSNNTDTMHIAGGNAAGCDSVARLSLTVRHKSYRTDRFDVCDSLTWIDSVRYTASTTTPTFTLSVPNAEGCDSVAKLDLTVRHSTSYTDVRDVCDTLVWHGTAYAASTATPTFDTVNAVGCDSLTTLNLTVRYRSWSNDPHDVCDTFTWVNHRLYTSSDSTSTYSVGLNEAGCDSSLHLSLTVRYSSTSLNTPNVCDEYYWDATGETYYRSLDTVVYLTNEQNCDSVLTMNLVVRHRDSSIVNANVCDYYTWHDSTYTASTDTPTFDTINAVGCDSTAHLHLIVRYSTSSTDVRDVCDTLVWHGAAYTASTTSPTFDTINAAGCDSLTRLDLTVRYSTDRHDTVVACDEYVWVDSVRYTADNNTATFHVQSGNTVGCDSVAHLHLTVNYNTNSGSRLTACDQYTWYNHGAVLVFDTSGTYYNNYLTDENCPSTDTLFLTVKYNSNTAFDTNVCDRFVWVNHDSVHTYTLPGTYYNSYVNTVGCPSTDTLRLTLRHNSDTAFGAVACDTFQWINHGLDTTLTESGEYRNSYLNAELCPSTDTLRLTINRNTDSVFYVEACDKYVWNRDTVTYTSDTIVRHIRINEVLCPTVDSLFLTVYHNTNTPYTDTACNRYTWSRNDITYSFSGTYTTDIYYNSDSVCANRDTLHLTIYHSTNTGYRQQACDTFHWVNHDVDTVLYESGTYYSHYMNSDSVCHNTDSLILRINYNTDSTYYADTCNVYVWNNHDSTFTFTQSGTYVNPYMTPAGCPSVDTLLLVVRYSSDTLYYDTACDEYYWYRTDTVFHYTASGEYTHLYTSPQGCLSTDTLRLTIYHNSSSILDTAVCESYTWPRNGVTYDSTGHYGANYLTPQGCPSVDSLFLRIDQRQDSLWVDTACDVYMWPRNRMFYSDSGYHEYTYGPYLVPGNSCFHTDTLHLTLYTSDHGGNEAATGCDTFYWHGTAYVNSGNFSFDTTTVHGCDSTVVLHLTMHYKSDTTYIVPHACDFYLWERGDSISFYYDSTGSYAHKYFNRWGCLSTDTLELNIFYNSDTTYIDTACDLYVWRPIYDVDGWTNTYTASGQDTHRYVNIVGCPSIDTLNLTIYDSPRADDNRIVCDSLVWRDGVTYYEDNDTATFSTHSSEWCDSIITLKLKVNYSIHYDSVDYFCDSTTFIFHDSVIYTPGIYHYGGKTTAGCDSLIDLVLHQLPRPVITLDVSHSCETFEYTIRPVFDSVPLGLGYEYLWDSRPQDLTLYGQETDSVVIVHPVVNTVYSLTTGYTVLPTCLNMVNSDTLVPIVQPHSVIKTTPPFVETPKIKFRAIDKGYDYEDRYWYFNGVAYGSNEYVDYTELASNRDYVEVKLVNTTTTCADSAIVLVPIHNFTLYIPNIFTPTEAINTEFKVIGKSVDQFEMWIYTREGLLVFHSTNIHEGWDGRYDGKLCSQAAYVYQVRYTNKETPDAWHTTTGTVTLVR